MEQILILGTIFNVLRWTLMAVVLYIVCRAVISTVEQSKAKDLKDVDTYTTLGRENIKRIIIGFILLFSVITMLYVEPIFLRPKNTMDQTNKTMDQTTEALENRADGDVPPAEHGQELENMEEKLDTIKDDFKELEPVEKEKPE